VTGFRLGDVVTLRGHERLCRVLDVNDPENRVAATDAFCVTAILIGPLDCDEAYGWVVPSDLALAQQ
jgi:hypothetical protein